MTTAEIIWLLAFAACTVVVFWGHEKRIAKLERRAEDLDHRLRQFITAQVIHNDVTLQTFQEIKELL